MAINKDLSRYWKMENDQSLHPKHRKLIAVANRLLNGACFADGSPDLSKPGMRSVVVGPSLERIPLTLVIGLFARGDSGPGFVAKIRKQMRGEIIDEMVEKSRRALAVTCCSKGLPAAAKHLSRKRVLLCRVLRSDESK